VQKFNFIVGSISAVVLTACGAGNANDTAIRNYNDLFSPLPNQAHYPADNPYSLAKAQLGEALFWDPVLSGDKNVACATCHHPDFGWADGRQFSIGSDGAGLATNRTGQQMTNIHSPTILNTAFTGLTVNESLESFIANGYFWDLRAQSLEEQSFGPIKNPVEMTGYHISPSEINGVIFERLSAIDQYVTMFNDAFGNNAEINSETISQAIATFERQLISPNTRFDRFLQGDQAALTPLEITGLNRFIDVGCSRCHNGPMLSDNMIHEGEFVIDSGKAVRTPSLRNLTFTAPFMQDGSRETLADAIAVYENRDDLQVTLNDGDVASIEAFLRTITQAGFYQKIPLSVPSKLSVGGNIN